MREQEKYKCGFQIILPEKKPYTAKKEGGPVKFSTAPSWMLAGPISFGLTYLHDCDPFEPEDIDFLGGD